MCGGTCTVRSLSSVSTHCVTEVRTIIYFQLFFFYNVIIGRFYDALSRARFPAFYAVTAPFRSAQKNFASAKYGPICSVRNGRVFDDIVS